MDKVAELQRIADMMFDEMTPKVSNTGGGWVIDWGNDDIDIFDTTDALLDHLAAMQKEHHARIMQAIKAARGNG